MSEQKPKKAAEEKTTPNPIWQQLKNTLTRNLPSKILSVVLAILLWGMVIANDSSITRTRTITGVTPLISGQNTLASSLLALVENPMDNLVGGVTVELDVPQAQYSLPNENNVRVWLDLSGIRTSGVQMIPLNVTSSYGTVLNIYPSNVEVNVEALDSRSVPLNARLTGRQEGYWYSVKSLNPATITVSGASSIVQNISQGFLDVDVSEMTESVTQAYPFELHSYTGTVVSQQLLTRTSTTVTAALDVFPTKELPVSVDQEDVLQGTIAEGYTLKSITVSPSTVTVAAEQSLLDGLTELTIEPIETDSISRSFTVRRPVSKLSDIRYFSTEQVYVTVEVEENTESVAFSDISVVALNMPDDLEINDKPDNVTVRVTGPYSQVAALTADMIQATVDLKDASGGVNSYPVSVSVTGHPSLTFEVSPSTLPVSLGQRSASN